MQNIIMLRMENSNRLLEGFRQCHEDFAQGYYHYYKQQLLHLLQLFFIN